MQRSTRTLIYAATAMAFALGAANAYAAETGQGVAIPSYDASSAIWIHHKTAVSDKAAVIRVDESLPHMIVPLNTRMEHDSRSDAVPLRRLTEIPRTDRLDGLDLVQDSPFFIGAQGPTEFDTRDAKRDTGAYPDALGIDPLFPVAGAGLEASF